MYLIFSVLGLIGGLMCATGNVFLDFKGNGNKKLGINDGA